MISRGVLGAGGGVLRVAGYVQQRQFPIIGSYYVLNSAKSTCLLFLVAAFMWALLSGDCSFIRQLMYQTVFPL
ncbi:hypothetical protein F2Q70_00031613 [Brassica cretica]|uniref:Uncharacterized protein n=1 Tax=Brassica cretica TaxID=69181 RepID=A0A8S9FHU3_BRACR|nr:hypothetical protein F2Q70_00031613 [Brassica cretica]KAF2549703.1 hypothetical protein F2Q68_00036049 [Brassica cretica]